MGTQIRPVEPQCEIALIKGQWLEVLAFLTHYQEQAASDEIDAILTECRTIIRTFIFAKTPDQILSLKKEDALELYLHCRDFEAQIADQFQAKTILEVISTIRKFLLEGAK